MAQRQQLQILLERLEGNVYFQPPKTLQMVYPCIVYKLDGITVKHADNLPYTSEKRYEITHIDRKPESPVVDELIALPKCRFGRNFVSDGLNHNTFTLYF